MNFLNASMFVATRSTFFSVFAFLGLLLNACTQETQNQLSRSVQNWTGTDGVLDIVSEGKLMYRFIEIDKLSTAHATSAADEKSPRPYRFGYGVLDVNQNYARDTDESKVYFEISDFSTSYVFYEKPKVVK